ncbi:hypothetical protein FOMG_19938 [Fusarium oxysporum f. sp. melonis 26406]|uniref:Uncharacterized protein n=1 Tax=Fusarium oxysporum f. sp. melonis 26406 TaxID=1089452 RepID=W9YUN1_FUSOX|nr:hypothetical protein FOMG_19938 [Fusarium oxysporum f. sp. melonis 26406]
MVSLWDHVFMVDRSGYNCCGSTALGPVRPPSLQPVASFAARSASSLPWIPICAGTHLISVFRSCVRSSSICCVIFLSRYAPDLPLGLAVDRMAAWLSV